VRKSTVVHQPLTKAIFRTIVRDFSPGVLPSTFDSRPSTAFGCATSVCTSVPLWLPPYVFFLTPKTDNQPTGSRAPTDNQPIPIAPLLGYYRLLPPITAKARFLPGTRPVHLPVALDANSPVCSLTLTIQRFSVSTIQRFNAAALFAEAKSPAQAHRNRLHYSRFRAYYPGVPGVMNRRGGTQVGSVEQWLLRSEQLRLVATKALRKGYI
jgi:hypothetical protein